MIYVMLVSVSVVSLFAAFITLFHASKPVYKSRFNDSTIINIFYI